MPHLQETQGLLVELDETIRDGGNQASLRSHNGDLFLPYMIAGWRMLKDEV